MEEKVQITIPKANEKEVANIPSGSKLGCDMEKKFEKIDGIIFGIVLVLMFSLIAIIVSVIGLFLDQMRYNNAAYREYSEKIQMLDSSKEVNNELLQQNKQNQKIILKQQNQILKLLSKNLEDFRGEN